MKYIIDVPDDLYVMNGELHIPWRFGENPTQNWLNTGIKTEPINTDIPDVSCTKCKYDDREEWEEPCRRCRNSYCSMWKENIE